MTKTAIPIVLAALFSSALAANNDAHKTPKTIEHVSCSGAANEIKVIIKGVKKSQGLVTADLFPNQQEGFLRGRGRVKQVKFAAKAPQTAFCIAAPAPGMWAMSAYHDRNANGKFDKTGLGLPAEPWGISNNPGAAFGPPPVEKAIFEVSEDGAVVEIKLN